eukprot:532660_1
MADKILQKRKDTVTGYIRLFVSLKIPTPIINICMLYYGNGKDIFDPKYISPHMTLYNDKKSVRVNNDWVLASAYLSVIVDSGIHTWQFKIRKPMGMIGICKVCKNITPQVNNAFTVGKEGKCQGYAYSIGDNSLSNVTNGKTAGKYAVPYISGSSFYPTENGTINMTLNLENLTLSFAVDGFEGGTAFHIEKCAYRAAVYGYCKEIGFEIIDFN